MSMIRSTPQQGVAAACSTNLVAALCAAEIGALPRRIKFRNTVPDECLKLLVAHVAEFIYMGALDLLHLPPGSCKAVHLPAGGPPATAPTTQSRVSGHLFVFPQSACARSYALRNWWPLPRGRSAGIEFFTEFMSFHSKDPMGGWQFRTTAAWVIKRLVGSPAGTRNVTLFRAP